LDETVSTASKSADASKLTEIEIKQLAEAQITLDDLVTIPKIMK